MDEETRAAFEALDQQLDRRFRAVDRRLDDVDRRLDAIDQRLDGVDRRFDVVDRHFELIDQRFDGVEERFEAVEQRIVSEAEETRRQFGVVAESLRRDITLLVRRRAPGGVRRGPPRHRRPSGATAVMGLVDPPVVRGQGGVRPPSPPSVIIGAARGWTSATRPARVAKTASP